MGTTTCFLVVIYLLCYSFLVVLGTPSSLNNRLRLWNYGTVYCGRESLQLILPVNQAEIFSLLSVLDEDLNEVPPAIDEVTLLLSYIYEKRIDSEGKFQPLDNSTCGDLVSQKRDGFIAFTAPYARCLFLRKNGNFLMTFRIKSQDTAGKFRTYDEELMCPIHFPALDAPSSSVCLGVQRQDRLPCVTESVSQEECGKKGCCYTPNDPHTACYYGNTVTAQCTPDGHFSIAVSRDVTLPSLILDSVHLVNGHGSGCSPVTKNDAFILYKFPLTACGTTLQVTEGQGIYANELVAHRDVQNWNTGSITRDSTFRLYVDCSYSTEDHLSLAVQVFTLPPIPLITQYGPLDLELRIAHDQHYSEYYSHGDYPVVKVLRDPVFLEVRILRRTDPKLVLVLHECWATPSTNPLQQPQWPILVNRCPYEGDNYQTRFVAVEAAVRLQFPSHHQRFIITTFTFVDSASRRALTGPVYFHCSASACAPSETESCMPWCPRSRVRRAPVNQALPDVLRSLVMAEGAVDFQIGKTQTEQEGSCCTKSILSQEWERALLVAMGVVIVALAFVGLRYWKRSKYERVNVL